MATVDLCNSIAKTAFELSYNEHFPPDKVNDLTRENIQARQLALGGAAPRITSQKVDIDALLQQEEASWPLLLQGLRESQSNQSTLPRLPPLDDCIMSIVWELHDMPSLGIVSEWDATKFLVLLRSAAFYQAKNENVSPR